MAELNQGAYMTKQQALLIFGGATNTAKALGIKQPSVSEWAEGEIPKLRAYEIEEVLFQWCKALNQLPRVIYGF